MSRSIHRTKHDLERLERFDTSDDARRLAEIERAREELARKRRIKSQVQAERRGNVLRAAALPTEQITIRERDSGEYVHFPATPADLRALLNRLPGGASDALTLIELCLGKGYQKQQTGELYATAVPDPHTGRIGHELIPGYFSGTSHGHYACETPIIRLFAYVYALSAPFRREIELFCKMLMLSTFVHELAHHHDFSMRVARERWLADQDDKLEMYAEQIQHEWVQQFVVPYLLETYPEEVAALDRWITHYGGAKIPLSMLAGDPRKTAVRGCVTEVAFFNISEAFVALASDVIKGKPLSAARIGFSRELHYIAHYDISLKIIDRVLSSQPDDCEAQKLKADIYVHQNRYDEAHEVIARVLEVHTEDVEALEILADSHEGRGNWNELLTVTDLIVARCVRGLFVWCGAVRQQAVAKMELGDTDGYEAALDELLKASRSTGVAIVRRLRKKYGSDHAEEL